MLKFCHAETVDISQVSGSPVFVYLLGEFRSISRQGLPLINPESLNLFWGKLFGTSNAHWGQVFFFFFFKLDPCTEKWVVTIVSINWWFLLNARRFVKARLPGLNFDSCVLSRTVIDQTVGSDYDAELPPPSPFAILPASGAIEPAGLGMLLLWEDLGPLMRQNTLTRDVLL